MTRSSVRASAGPSAARAGPRHDRGFHRRAAACESLRVRGDVRGVRRPRHRSTSSTGPSGSRPIPRRAILGLAPDELIGRMPAETVRLLPRTCTLLAAAIDRLRKGDDTVDVHVPRPDARPAGPSGSRRGSAPSEASMVRRPAFVAVSRLVTDRLEAERRQQDPAGAVSPGHRRRAGNDRLDRRPRPAMPLRCWGRVPLGRRRPGRLCRPPASRSS